MTSFTALFALLLATSASASASAPAPAPASVPASPVVTVPLTKLHRIGGYLKGSPDADRTRAAFLKSRASSDPSTVPATDVLYMQYTTSVGIGSPPTYYNLAVDTGSSNTFCGTRTPYVQTSTSIPTGENVSVSYGLGFFSGVEYLDQVALAPDLVITNQSIGDALSSANFASVDGILGVGPVRLTKGSLSPDGNATIPTVMDNLVSQGLIECKVLGVYFAPATNGNDTNGALTYGGTDPSLYQGSLTYVPMTTTYPAAYYWGINITRSTYGTHTIINASTAGIVDTGTTVIILADDFFNVYMNAIPGAEVDPDTGLLEIPASSIPSMEPLNFLIAGRVFTLDVAAQLVPTDQNVVWGGVSGKQYGVVANMGQNSGEGLDFLIGQKFMERYYAVFDAEYSRVGFAQTNSTFTTYQG